MITIGLISQKGGCGKTTTAINLAVAAQQDGAAVAIVDLDVQASATDWYERRPESDEALTVQPVHARQLKGVLEAARGQGADFVFIDTAAKTESDAVAALEVSDLVLVPCKPSLLDVLSIQNTLRLCQHRSIKPYALLTQVEPQGTVADETRDTLTQLGFEVLPEMLGRRVAYTHSLIGGQAVTEYDPRGKAAQEVTALLRRLKGLPVKSVAKAEQREEVPA